LAIGYGEWVASVVQGAITQFQVEEDGGLGGDHGWH
jgi:hypothetical protein